MKYYTPFTSFVRVPLFLGVLLVSNNGFAGQEQDLAKFNTMYEEGRYKDASEFELKLKGDKKADQSRLLETMQTAAALRYDKKYEESGLLFDECEEIIKAQDEKIGLARLTTDLAATIANDKAVAYKRTEYDGIMVNTYKALNFWQRGEFDLARTEFNRAIDRERRAKERFASEISKTKDDDSKKTGDSTQKSDSANVDKNLCNPELVALIDKNYSNLDEYKTYPDFINPFTDYIAGLFFLSEGDYAKAADLFKVVYGMTGKNTIVLTDLAQSGVVDIRKSRIPKSSKIKSNQNKVSESLSNSGKKIWVIFENGMGPVKEEIRVDVPLFLVTNQVKYTGIALPRLKLRDNRPENLVIKTIENGTSSTVGLSSMDCVVRTEFKKRYPVVLRRAIAAAIIKTAMQGEAQKRFGNIGGLLGGLAQRALTSADLRLWTALPKEFQIAKLDAPKDGMINIGTQDGKGIDIAVPSDKNSLVYVKIPTIGAVPYYDVITFKN
jgi:uncharacterized protein